jgi:exodeoxyribonuclease-3
MRIATWNVNSIRARLPRVLPWLAEKRPDVVLLQETKCLDEQFPREPIEELGYNIECFGQKTYNGVAILAKSRITTCSAAARRGRGRRGARARRDGRGRDGVSVLRDQRPGGRRAGVREKLEWLRAALQAHRRALPHDGEGRDRRRLQHHVRRPGRLRPEAWREKILCSTPEREALTTVMECGLADAFRKLTVEGGHYTWWDFRTRGFQYGNGLRIDHFLMSPPALAACSSVEIDLDARRGEKPSDHAPVIATLA